MKVFWSAAVGLSVWELLVEPMFAEVRTVVCSGGVPFDMARPSLLAEAAEFLGERLALLQPILLALVALWAVRSRVRIGPAALGLAVAVLPAALAEAGNLLSPEPPFWWRECLEAQLSPPSFAVPRLVLAWLVSPATMVLLAGIARAGIRPRLTDLRNAGIAVVVVGLVALLPGVLSGLPVNADGTPRYVVAGGGIPYVLDLESGEPVSRLPRATRTYAQASVIVRDAEPGHYVAAFSSPLGRYFRLYRMTMGADGRITVGERLTPTLEGMANGLAVSAEGRVAYARMTDTASFVGTLEREWPFSGYGLQWLNAGTLALPSHSVPASTLATLDVGTGVIRDVAAPVEHEFTRPLLVLPGGRQLRVLGWPARTLVLHEGTRLVRKVLTLDCGHIESLALAPTGRHLLVGVDREAEEMDRSPLAGLPPCGGAAAQLLRLDLESGETQVVPGRQEPWVQAW
ncbi:hypothetical protein Acor_26760 [Acrocarpospora corrugata]|uniref:Uncharacterized protein n=1 Tax=Acrocarpospora corrugata TaxID=35763 RepID=A0A5M3VY00_9ACTN|nr:hypothetical protein Acor_26760 [Acrocarpospora corrugata]